MASKPGFDVRDRDRGDTARQRPAERARSVALDDQQVGRLAQLRQDRRGDPLDVRMGVVRARAVEAGRRIGAEAMVGGVEAGMLTARASSARATGASLIASGLVPMTSLISAEDRLPPSSAKSICIRNG